MDTPLFHLSPFVKSQFESNLDLFECLEIKDFDLESDWRQYQKNNTHLDVFSLCRNYRKSRLALIAARDDCNKTNSYLTTLEQTSQLARLMVQYVYQVCCNEFKQKYGQVIDEHGKSQELIIYALGKLGGNELNFSSDIDLVFCYTSQGCSNGRKQLDATVYFERLGRRLIQILNNHTQDGIVYRVDMRLRPFGDAAPLVCSTDHLLNYLQTEGRDWERYAWLRASFIAGNKAIGQQTLDDIQPFIYRKYLDFGVFESLRQIKEQIIRKQVNDPENIKLGTGGIREIEFIVQTLQLTLAGRNKNLQGNDLWNKLHLLSQLKQLSDNELCHLSEAWLFLRKLENLCQIIDDRSTHHFPMNNQAMADCMGYKSNQELLEYWNKHRQLVHTIFQSIFKKTSKQQDYNNSHPNIQQLKDKVSQQSNPKQTKHKIYAALDALSVFLPNYTETQQHNIISRYFQVIQATSKRPNYLSMLIESPFILQKLLKLLNKDSYFSNHISKHPVLLEMLFEKFTDTDFDFTKQWDLFQKKHSIDDTEDYIEILCQFKQRMQFQIITTYIENNKTATQTCHWLSELAELVLSLCIQKAWIDCKEKIETDIISEDLIIIAYGSLAMKSMHLDSDFDIVFVLDKDISEDNHRFVMRWIKRIMHLLTAQTYSGYLYKLDTQLRPNGNSGAAVVTHNNFHSYQLNSAWIWEHAALIKTRVVYGNNKQKLWFEYIREQALCRPRNAEIVIKELNEMAEKLQRHHSKKHLKEFSDLADILIKAHLQPEIINQYLRKNNSELKKKLDLSIHG